YETYEEIDFEPQVWHDGGAGDSYARFECRFNELNESCKIILQALEKMPKTGPYRVKPPRRAEGEGYAKTEDSRGDALSCVIVRGVTVSSLFTVMWVERRLYGRLQERCASMSSVWSLPFWPFNRVHRRTHKGLGYLQTLADGVKLIQTENITPRNADSAMFE